MADDEALFLLGRSPTNKVAKDTLVASSTASSNTRLEARSTALPDWAQAEPNKIARSLERALSRPTGGWAVVASSRSLGKKPMKVLLDGREWVLWRCHEGPRMAPEACPHMGAELSKGHVDKQGKVVCPWHGLALSDAPRGNWRPIPTYDDGVLIWARLESLLAPGEQVSEKPFMAKRPERFLDAVISLEATCEPRDVIANRLDPWHGAHFHPHSFAQLKVIEETEDAITVRVVFRILGRLGMKVDAQFSCPDARTIVMTIVSGEGVGSVVETHATPIGPNRTAVIEATLATSERRSMLWLPYAAWIRPLAQLRAKRLWVEDADYCERLFALRKKGDSAPSD